MLDRLSEIQTVEGADVATTKETSSAAPSVSKRTATKQASPTIGSKPTVDQNDKIGIQQISPSVIKNWIFHDRPINELGDIEALAEEFKTVGQQQPCIVRPIENVANYQYELIAGERRWRAAIAAGMNLQVIIRQLDDHQAALCQAAENSNRQDLSASAKGLNYAALLEKGIISRQDLQNKLKLSKSSVRNLLSFARIDKDIVEALQDISKLSSTTAYEITRIQEKSAAHKSALLALAPKLREGKIGHQTLERLIEDQINNNKEAYDRAAEIRSCTGRHLFTWRRDSNGKKSISFPKDVRKLIDFELLEKTILEEIEKQIESKPTAG